MIAESPMKGVYDEREDRESAYEILHKRTSERVAQAGTAPSPSGRKGDTEKESAGWFDWLFGTGTRKRLSAGQKVARETTRRTGAEIGGAIGKSLGGKQGEALGKSIARGVLGGILRR